MKKQTKQQGSMLVSLVITIPSLILIATHYLQLSVNSFRIARQDQFRNHAQFAADAGIDDAIQELNQDDSWAGTAAPFEVHNDGNIRVTFETTVINIGLLGDKRVVSIGKTYSPTSEPTPDATIKLESDLRPVEAGNFSIVTGVGGLYLSNSAKVLGGDVFVNGEVSMTNSSQIGLLITPVIMKVAHQNCPNPPDFNYPRLCASGENGEPISIENTAHIYGEVTANNQTNGSNMSSPGLVGSSGVTPRPLPIHDRAAQKAAIITTTTGALASCTNNFEVKTWAPNLKIVGDVLISKSCNVIVQGDVWITGNLVMENSSSMTVADPLGVVRPNIMVDGPITSFKNSAQIVSNINDTGVQIINYWSNTACSPDCADVTGVDLYNTRNDVTIELDNNAGGPHTIFYSRWTKVLISNSGSIGALVGQTVELKNSATITFGTSAGTGQTYWVIEGYRRFF